MASKTKQIKTEAEVHSELLEALRRVSDEKNIPVEALVASIEGALVSAYKKAYGGTGAVRVVADFATSEFRVFAQKRVVQTALNGNTEVAWREARVDSPGINLGDEVEKEVTPSGFGRIAAQTAKQVLMQKLREAERVQVVSEYADKSGQMFRGTVQRSERGDMVVAIGKAEAILPRREQVPGENYRFGDSIYCYVVEVRSNMRGPSIRVSRTHPGLVHQLFLLEVPEIADGIVELKAVAREAGQRTKIAVAANNPDVDPVGACVGPRGMRVGKVVAELGNEKVDIVRWNA
ncbi:MAG TPA: transcription termination factor NusA, partial [Abditibacteriaceae bacterium]